MRLLTLVRPATRPAGLIASILLAALLLSSPALADSVEGTRSQLLVERDHVVSASVDRGALKLVTRRTVFNGGARHDQAMFHIRVPEEAVATGLRTLGSLNGKPKWFAGELMEAEAAAAKYRELTGIGGYYPKDPALLSWRSQGDLALQVFPCAPAEEKTIEYTLELPMTYSEGRYRVTLPMLGTTNLPARIELQAARAGDRVLLDGKPWPAGQRYQLPRNANTEIQLEPSAPATISGAFAQLPLAKGRVLTRFGFQLAPTISKAPVQANIVILIDASRSMTPAKLDAAQAVARSYLTYLPDAHVEVIHFARKPRRRFNALVSAEKARLDLEAFSPSLKNGSELGAALEAADVALAGAAGGPRRVLLLTDTLTRLDLKAKQLKGALAKSKALLHVLDIEASGHARLQRSDTADLSEVAATTGGVFWQADWDGGGAGHAAVEELVRPMRLHQLAITAPGVPQDSLPYVEELPEGEGVEVLDVTKIPGGFVRVQGKLWQRKLSRTLTPSADATRLWSALVFGQSLMHQLSEPEMMTLAMRGGAVSPVTSYLAIEPGVRPSTEGLEWGLSGVGSGGGGMGAGIGMGSGSFGQTVDKNGAWLSRRLAPAMQRCGGLPGTLKLHVETTRIEVVAVTEVKASHATAQVAACVTKAAWQLALPRAFYRDHASYAVNL